MKESKREFKVYFLQDTEIRFLLPSGKGFWWYGSDYWKGTSLVVSDIVSGGETTIRVRCLDGEVGVLETQAIRIESEEEDVRPPGLLPSRAPSNSVQRPQEPPVARGNPQVAVVQKRHQGQTPGSGRQDPRVQVYRSSK